VKDPVRSAVRFPRDWGGPFFAWGSGDMNIYRMLGSRLGTPDAYGLAERLSAWHDAMVAHERRRERSCDDECPHADARVLWSEASQTFGERAAELVFLKSRALGARYRGIESGLTV
jgi:hypothetical protein